MFAEHSRDVADTPARATAIKTAARGWADFWDGHLDLDALAVDVTEHLADLQESRARVERLTAHARKWWENLYGDDPLILFLPGVGPATGHCIRAYVGDGSGRSDHGPAARRVLLPVHDRTRTPPHPGHYRGRQEAGRTDVEDPRHRANV